MKSILVLVTMIISLFGFAGGGGSSSDYGGGSSSSSGSDYSFSNDYSKSSKHSRSSNIVEDMVIFVLVIVVNVYVFSKLVKTFKKKTKNSGRMTNTSEEQRQTIATPASIDHNDTEQEKWIHQEAEKIFRKYQEDWSNYNLKNIQEYTTDYYYQHACLMLEAIDKAGRRNMVSDLLVSRVYLFTPVNDGYDLPMKVQMMFRFSGTDGIVDKESNRTIHSNRVQGINEYWNFIYDEKSLKLDGITQSTESTPHLIQSIANFAQQNQLYYSPDWGRLALPTEGLIFNSWGLTRADVNNHVVGQWSNCLVQMYTYSATPDNPNSYYLVGQINVPKSYEGVIIEAKKAKLKAAKPKNYEKFKLEWEDFNRRYRVYAASGEAVTAFELLNPTFMTRLYNRNLKYNLEVIGNTIYIFAKVTEAQKEDYTELLNVLTEAFNELKM